MYVCKHNKYAYIYSFILLYFKMEKWSLKIHIFITLLKSSHIYICISIYLHTYISIYTHCFTYTYAQISMYLLWYSCHLPALSVSDSSYYSWLQLHLADIKQPPATHLLKPLLIVLRPWKQRIGFRKENKSDPAGKRSQGSM